MFVFCLLFLLETWNADRIAPNPASPLVWALLGTVAVVCLALALWLGHRAWPAESAGQWTVPQQSPLAYMLAAGLRKHMALQRCAAMLGSSHRLTRPHTQP